MNNFLKLSFWFDLKPLPFAPKIFWISLLVCLVCLALGIITSYLKVKKFRHDNLKRKIWAKLGNWSYSFSIIGLILAFFKQQMTLYLGMRFWFLLWGLIWFVWFVFIIKYIVVEVPKIKKEAEKKREFEKYLP